MRRSLPTGAALVAPPPACSKTTTVIYLGFLYGAKPINKAWSLLSKGRSLFLIIPSALSFTEIILTCEVPVLPEIWNFLNY